MWCVLKQKCMIIKQNCMTDYYTHHSSLYIMHVKKYDPWEGSCCILCWNERAFYS